MKARFSEINTLEELNEVFRVSKEKPVLIFKHSTTCSISRNVHGSVSRIDADINLITVQTSRDLSNAVAEHTGIKHESPQAIVLRGGSPVYHASHFDIDPKVVLQHLS